MILLFSLKAFNYPEDTSFQNMETHYFFFQFGETISQYSIYIMLLLSFFLQSADFKWMKYFSLYALTLYKKMLSAFQRHPMQTTGMFVTPQQFTFILEKLK